MRIGLDPNKGDDEPMFCLLQVANPETALAGAPATYAKLPSAAKAKSEGDPAIETDVSASTVETTYILPVSLRIKIFIWSGENAAAVAPAIRRSVGGLLAWAASKI